MVFALFRAECEAHLQQGYELKRKCGLSEIVLLRFDLATVEEDHGVGGPRTGVLHGPGVFPFATHRPGDRGEAVVEAPRAAGYDSEGPIEPLYALGHPPRLVN
jgi:hypothetical protein